MCSLARRGSAFDSALACERFPLSCGPGSPPHVRTMRRRGTSARLLERRPERDKTRPTTILAPGSHALGERAERFVFPFFAPAAGRQKDTRCLYRESPDPRISLFRRRSDHANSILPGDSAVSQDGLKQAALAGEKAAPERIVTGLAGEFV